jgi:phospholipase/carboxylesterase
MNQTTALLEFVEINPPQQAIGSVIWLHGLGANGDDFVPLIPELKLPSSLPLRFIFPHAPERPVTINGGYVMRAWYDIVSMHIDQHADKSGIDNAVQQVHGLIANENRRGIPMEKIILAGFSQGAVIALSTGLTFPERLGGILALSGYLPYPEKVAADVPIEGRSIPIFLGHGSEDSVVPQMLGNAVHHALNKHHFSAVSWHSYKMAHSVCLEEIEDISHWLQQVFGK